MSNLFPEVRDTSTITGVFNQPTFMVIGIEGQATRRERSRRHRVHMQDPGRRRHVLRACEQARLPLSSSSLAGAPSSSSRLRLRWRRADARAAAGGMDGLGGEPSRCGAPDGLHYAG
jgi:hypothetical protein